MEEKKGPSSQLLTKSSSFKTKEEEDRIWELCDAKKKESLHAHDLIRQHFVRNGRKSPEQEWKIDLRPLTERQQVFVLNTFDFLGRRNTAGFRVIASEWKISKNSGERIDLVLQAGWVGDQKENVICYHLLDLKMRGGPKRSIWDELAMIHYLNYWYDMVIVEEKKKHPETTYLVIGGLLHCEDQTYCPVDCVKEVPDEQLGIPVPVNIKELLMDKKFYNAHEFDERRDNLLAEISEFTPGSLFASSLAVLWEERMGHTSIEHPVIIGGKSSVILGGQYKNENFLDLLMKYCFRLYGFQVEDRLNHDKTLNVYNSSKFTQWIVSLHESFLLNQLGTNRNWQNVYFYVEYFTCYGKDDERIMEERTILNSQDKKIRNEELKKWFSGLRTKSDRKNILKLTEEQIIEEYHSVIKNNIFLYIK